MKKSLLTIPSLFLLSFAAQAQISGSGAYMKGLYVEIGIDGQGGFEGADTVISPVPSGMHFRSNTPYMGFLANPQMDGWVNFNGDFFTPGTPENGWGIEIIDNGGLVDIQANNNCTGLWDIPGAITSYTYASMVHTVIWEGDYINAPYDLHFTIEYTLHDSAHAYNTNVTVSNNGDPIDELYYFRNIDPDNNVILTSDYTTTHTIVAQASGSSAYCAVSAEQSLPWYSVYTLSTNDTTARVSFGGFSNRDGSDVWNGTGGLTGLSGASNYADEAISISCRMDSLFAFRQSRSFTFTSSFDGAGIITGTADINTDNLSVSPNPTSGMLNIRSKEAVKNITVYNTLGKLQMQSTNALSIDLSSLEAGIYLVSIETTAGKVTRRIIKD